jgi:simple sugar transport system permease protein
MGFLAVGAIWYLIYRTNWGLAVRGCGDDPQSVDALGLDVVRLRYQAAILGSVLASLGGAIISLSNLHVFVEGMTAGRGFLALAAYIFGKWSPLGTLGACLLFGITDAFQLHLQTLGIHAPYQLLIALPYLFALAALVGVVGRARAPRAVAIPFIPDRHAPRREAWYRKLISRFRPVATTTGS